jgi:hypothetical protein
MQRPAPIGGECFPDGFGARFMQLLKVLQETNIEGADLAGGQVDPVLALQRGADLLSLTMVKETLKSHLDDDVIADHRPTGYELCERLWAMRNSHAGRVATACLAHEDGFANLERPELQSHAVTP